VDGVDGYIIGPYDLSSSIGFPGDLENREVTDLIAKIQEAGERAGIPGGIHLVEPNIKKVKEFVDKGLSIIGYGMDVRVLDSIYRSHLERIRDLL